MDAVSGVCEEAEVEQEGFTDLDECVEVTSYECGVVDLCGGLCYGRKGRYDGGEELYAKGIEILQE